ncbi:MAG: sensor histidine kinase [Paraburkholderia sp.]|nr:sensor histidine kinase [Paraburkholderia sp.]MDE1179958.1 sensor histidine kinase [Paraburkholderia sp.]
MNSLRLRLLLWLLLPTTVFVIAAGFITRSNALHTADLLQDGALLSSARVMAGDVGWQDGHLYADVSPSAIEILSSPHADLVFYSVREAGGDMIAGTSDFPRLEPKTSPEWYDTHVDGRAIRAVSVVRQLYDAGASRRVIVSVGRTTRERDAMAAQLWWPQMLVFASIVCISAIVVCVGLTFELHPLMRVAKGMVESPPDASVRLHAEPLRNELRPIVDAFNKSLDVIARQTATQRRFISDAAHQLRTPLTLLGTQLQYARRQQDVASIKETLLAMQRSNRSLVSLTNQLLLLAQAEAADYAHFENRPVDLRDVATDVIEQLAMLAQRRQIELAAQFDANSVVMGSAQLLSVLLFNLVDNAIRYTKAEGHVVVSIAGEPSGVTLSVTDDGPGIDASLRERVFEPFFRAADGEGSGLGLAIVREIARAHRAEIQVRNLDGASGLAVSVRFAPERGG